MKSIYIIGSINMDMTVKADRLPLMGESLVGSGFGTFHGGKGANQAVASSRLGANVKMCGCVGNDIFGKELKKSLDDEGIDTKFVYEADISTGVAVITVVNGNNAIVVDKGANEKVTPEQTLDFLKDAKKDDILLVQLETDFDAVKTGVSFAKEKDMFVVVNPAPAHKRAAELCELSDVFIPNETELEAITGTSDVEKGLFTLKDAGAKIPAVTLGGEGCAYLLDGKIIRKQCEKVVPVDTTGAGDTFCGGLCTGLSEGKSFEESVNFALKAATLSVTRAGAQQSIPYRDELK